MKNKLFLYAIILIAGLSSCKKDEIQNTTEPLSKEDLNTEALILGFKDKLQNNNFKSGETMSLNDAVWNMEASLNYDYAQADAQHEKTLHYTDYFYLQLNSSQEAELDEINDVLNQMADQLSVHYHAIGEENKSFIVGDVGLVIVQNNIAQLSMGSVFGIDPAGNCPPFENWEWWYAWSDGICSGPNQGQYLDRNGMTELESRLNSSDGGTLPPGMHIYYTDVDSTLIDAVWYNLIDDDGNYRMWVSEYNQWDPNTIINDCCSPETWQYYLDEADLIINNEFRPYGKVFIDVDVSYTTTTVGGVFEMKIYTYNPKYGIKHYGTHPIIIL